MHCSHDCLVTSCVLLAIFVAIQVSILTISYSNFNDGILEETKVQKKYSFKDRSPHGLFPSALIIGVRKAGTRALLDALGLHPDLSVVRKETHFFDLNYEKGLEWYRNNMPKSTVDNQLVVEKTPGYFTSRLSPSRVKLFNPSMKIILIVRDPVQRIVSDFTQVYYNKLETNKTLPVFEEEVFLAGTTELNLDYKPVRNSIYHLHMANWLKHFSSDQILLVNGDVFRGNPLHELRRVEDFLQLPHSISNDQLVFNEKKGFFCFVKSSKMKCLGSSKGRPHRHISTETLSIIRERLKEHNQKFFTQVNRIYDW